jgi:hypothetical protein
MSSTLLRLGIWIVILVLALYVIHETYVGSPVADMIPFDMLGKGLGVAVLLIIVGGVVRLFEKGKKTTSKSRCRVCRTPIPQGAIYCRTHLRSVLELEDRRTHNTRIR